MSNMVTLSLSRQQCKRLLMLLDAVNVALGADTPLWLRGVINSIRNVLYPGSFIN